MGRETGGRHNKHRLLCNILYAQPRISSPQILYRPSFSRLIKNSGILIFFIFAWVFSIG